MFVTLIVCGIVWFFAVQKPITSATIPSLHGLRLLAKPGADDTPLPQGSIKEPSISPEDARSKLRFHFRISLASLQRTLNKAIPRQITDPQNDLGIKGTITRSDLQLSANDASSLGVNSEIYFVGSAKKWGLEAKSATVNLAGSTLNLDFAQDWNWRIAPQVKAQIKVIDIKWVPGFAEPFAGWICNDFIIPAVAPSLSSQPPIAFRPLVESFWKNSNQDIPVIGEPLTVIGLRPEAVKLGGPLLERDGSLTVMVGLDVQSWAALGNAGKGLILQEHKPLPNLQKVPVSQETTELRLPILISLQDAPRLFQPQTLQVPGGTMKILSTELSEKDGLCYIRGKVRFDVTDGQPMARPFSGETTLVVQGRPSCDPVTGEIQIRDLAFTPKSDSILVEILGQGANTLRSQLQQLAPVFSGWVKNRLETHLNVEAEKFLKAQIQAWASAAPEFEAEIKSALLSVKNIQIKPTRLETIGGYFVLVIQARADLGLAIP